MDLVWAQVDSLRAVDPAKEVILPVYQCECGGLKDFEAELPTCMSCGRTDNSYISDEPEWRGGIDDDGTVTDPSRVGAPTDTRYSESWSMGTVMTVRSNSNYYTKKLARINFHGSMDSRDRSLFHNYADIEKAGEGLPKYVIHEAQAMYRKFNEEKLTRGAVRTGVKANCLLQACKQNKISRSIEEIASAFGISTRDISRTTEIFNESCKERKVTIVQASDLVVRMFNDFQIADDIRRRLKMKAIRLCETIQESVELMGKTPKTIAATVVFILVEPHGVDLMKVSESCDVSVQTIRKVEPVVRKLNVQV